MKNNNTTPRIFVAIDNDDDDNDNGVSNYVNKATAITSVFNELAYACAKASHKSTASPHQSLCSSLR